VMVLITVLIISLLSKEKTFEYKPISKDNLVWSRTTKNYLDTIVSVGLDILDVKGVSVHIKDMDKDVEVGEYTIDAYINGIPTQYIIHVNTKLSRDVSINVMAHELIHLLQIERGDLVQGKNSVIWMGKIYNDPKSIPYLSREWELQAYKDGIQLEKKLRSRLYGRGYNSQVVGY